MKDIGEVNDRLGVDTVCIHSQNPQNKGAFGEKIGEIDRK